MKLLKLLVRPFDLLGDAVEWLAERLDLLADPLRFRLQCWQSERAAKRRWKCFEKKHERAGLVVVGSMSNSPGLEAYSRYLRGEVTLDEFRNTRIEPAVSLPVYWDPVTKRFVD